jgi:hypothetical protein
MNMNLSDKFSTMMEKFFIWAKENEYVLIDMVDGSNIKWNMDLLSDFKEPGRNKIETFVKKLNKEYNLTKDFEKVLDIKLMVKNFKENKPKVVKNNNKKVSLDKKNVNSSTVPYKKTSTKVDVFLDKSLDTTNTYNIDTLEYFTYELIKAFGNPEEIENEDSKYEWKVNVDGDIYSIYDWNENKEKFEDITWYLGGLNEDNKKIKKLYKFIDNKNESEKSEIVNCDIKTEYSVDMNESEKSEIVNCDIKTEYSVDMNELFGEDNDDEKEINIDNIEDDIDINLDIIDESKLEIDIDNIDF